jgi:hypothetical protein
MNCTADFSGVTFCKRALFDYAKFKSIVFNNCEFRDLVSFQYFQAGNLTISRAIFTNGADFLNSKINIADRETFRIIKHEFQKINNQVEVLHYRAKEMLAYEHELKFKNNAWEYLLLQLNKRSNKHGLSWSRGLLFTLTLSILFYVLYLFTLEKLPFYWGWTNFYSFWKASGITIKDFIRFFIVTHDFDFMKEYNPSALSFIIDFISKIFIGYGIYQTIQAFRKYGKN